MASTSYREEMIRVFELRDTLLEPLPATAYFHNFEASLSSNPLKLRQFCLLEQDLQRLDGVAWAFLKKAVTPLLLAKDSKRGWGQLFDKLNQAKAYAHLVDRGYQGVKFIPESNVMTPDLEARDGSVRVLCEVKTFNTSDEEADRRLFGGVGDSLRELSFKFFCKLETLLKHAKAQMAAQDVSAKQIAYIIINFDDSLHEYADDYREQITRYMKESSVPELEVEFYWKPPFDSART